jgi:ABC-type nitrate/sulfonate/bicarbonate transport system substrate-binding protein
MDGRIFAHPRRSVFFALLGLVTALINVPATADRLDPATDTTPRSVRLGLFTRTLALLAGQSKGFFAQHNLTVDFLQAQSSPQQFQYLRDGLYDVIMTSPDNVANFRLNPNNALGAALDVKMFVGSDYGANLALAAQPGITAIADLRGRALGVDAPTSGFAYVLYKILRAGGLERGVDYTVTIAGGTAQRYAALLAGSFDGTMLNNGYERRAANAGYPLLASVSDVASPYLGAVGAARTSWLAQNPSVAVRFVRALYEATQWSLDPANREEAIGILMTQPNTPRALAEQMYAEQVRPRVGLIPEARLDRQALLNVLHLREEFGGFETPQDLHRLITPAGGLIELSYYRMAVTDPQDTESDTDTESAGTVNPEFESWGSPAPAVP